MTDLGETSVFGPVEIQRMRAAYELALSKIRALSQSEQIAGGVLRQLAAYVIEDVRDGLRDPGVIANNAARRVAGHVGYLMGKAIRIEIEGRPLEFTMSAGSRPSRLA